MKLAVVLASTVLFATLLDVVGMVLGSGLFLLGILRFLEGYRWLSSLGIAWPPGSSTTSSSRTGCGSPSRSASWGSEAAAWASSTT